jgi:hypothetical protein
MKTLNHPLKLSQTFQPRKASAGIHRIATKLWAALVSKIPVGYEDKTGFHYGTQASPRRSPAMARSAKPAATTSGTQSGARKVNRPKRQYHKHVNPMKMSPSAGLMGFSLPLLPLNLNETPLEGFRNQPT